LFKIISKINVKQIQALDLKCFIVALTSGETVLLIEKLPQYLMANYG
jgi:hypothetical protein